MKSSLIQAILENSNEAILITDAEGTIQYVNASFSKISGYEKEEVLGKNPRIMRSGHHDAGFYEEMWGSLKDSGEWQGEVWDRRKNGEIFPKWLSIKAVKDKRERTVNYVGFFTDISSLKQTEEYIEHLAHYDSLTNLPNRILLHDRLKQAIMSASRQNHLAAVMLLDVDQFKYVNDTFGHVAGDQLLNEVAGRLVRCVTEGDTVARFGGDEFAIVLSEFKNGMAATLLAKKIIEALSLPHKFKGREIYITASIGIALYPSDGDNVDVLIKNADTAMQRAKELGDRKFQFYDSQMSDKAFARLSVEANLHNAIERGEFVLHYQPQVDLGNGQVTGMEALIRRKERNWLVPPSQFIHIAEETGLIMQLCEWTLKTACKQNKAWQAEGLPALRVAVNLTATHFAQHTMVKMVRDVLQETGYESKYLDLELTERIIMKDTEEAIKAMHQLKDMGVFLSIDDFGTGYSSLSYLRQLPIDRLKIDLSFVSGIASSPNSDSIVKSIISLGHNLDLKVLAEGVETERQLSFLIENKCDEIQGYYFSVPLSTEKFRELLLEGRRLAV
ncbi:MAG TPA: EAL domain-containing protein [Thermodesulfovibrionales bacterium]|nr:EAL domain-containing protein [Thermodesulfovibrionales bacterium]